SPCSAAARTVGAPHRFEVSLERTGDLCCARVAATAIPETHRSEIMTGYFSRIARQGGARIAGDAGQRAGTPTSKTESHLSPIDHDKTVMVPPRASSDGPASKPARADVDTAVQDKTRGQKTQRSTSAIDSATKSLPAEDRP